jgi:hypothetical protein
MGSFLDFYFTFRMMDYSSDLWFATLVAIIFHQSTKKCSEQCPGCSARLRNPVLHLCHQLSLLDKVKIHFDETRGQLLSTIYTIYDSVNHKLPHSPDLDRDKEHYCNNAIVFLNSAHPDSIYWGRYLDESNDILIDNMISCLSNQKRKKCNKKKSPAKKKPQLEDLVQELLT